MFSDLTCGVLRVEIPEPDNRPEGLVLHLGDEFPNEGDPVLALAALLGIRSGHVQPEPEHVDRPKPRLLGSPRAGPDRARLVQRWCWSPASSVERRRAANEFLRLAPPRTQSLRGGKRPPPWLPAGIRLARLLLSRAKSLSTEEHVWAQR